jgi:hypothetical protein
LPVSAGPRFDPVVTKATLVPSGLKTGDVESPLDPSVPVASADTSVVAPDARSRT